MEKQIWKDTQHCQLRVHCRACRDLDGGRAFRNSIAEHYELPPGAPDFECPLGVPWGYNPPVKPAPPPPPCPPDATWCERFGLPTGPNACQVCTDTRENREDSEQAAWFVMMMRSVGMAFGAMTCVHRTDSGEVKIVKCCGGKEKEVRVFRCALNGQQAECGRCRNRKLEADSGG